MDFAFEARGSNQKCIFCENCRFGAPCGAKWSFRSSLRGQIPTKNALFLKVAAFGWGFRSPGVGPGQFARPPHPENPSLISHLSDQTGAKYSIGFFFGPQVPVLGVLGDALGRKIHGSSRRLAAPMGLDAFYVIKHMVTGLDEPRCAVIQ